MNENNLEQRKLNLREKMQIKVRKAQKKSVPGAAILITGLVLMAACFFLDGREVQSANVVPHDTTGSPLVMDFVGDVMIGRNIRIEGDQKGYERYFKNVKPYWDRADLVFANLECPILKGPESEYEKAEKNVQLFLYGDYAGVDAMLDAGVNMVGCANNHAFDYGPRPITELIAHFRERNVTFSGIGNRKEEAASYVVEEINGIKVAFVALTRVYGPYAFATDMHAGVNTTAYHEYNRVVAEASLESDLQVVYIHFGEENGISADLTQKNLARGLVDAGADLVIGSHPHVVQEMEFYKNSVIFYSLGNFVFDQGDSYNCDSMMVEFRLNKEGDGEMEIVPVRIESTIPTITDNEAYKARINHEVIQHMDPSTYTYDDQGHLTVKTPIHLDMDNLIGKK